MSLRLCCPGALDARSALPLPGRRLSGMGTTPVAAQVGAGDGRAGPRGGAPAVPLAMTSPPCSPAAGPDVDDPVGRPDGLLVVLDHDERVAQVAQPHERGDELGVVLLVEPDGRLVEDVQHAHEARADLGRQPDALRLAARQRGARPVERQVVEPDVDQEAEPRADLLEHLRGRWSARARSAARGAAPPRPARRVTASPAMSAMLRPSMVTPRTSGLSRLPPHAGQGRSTMYFSSSVLMYSESVSR